MKNILQDVAIINGSVITGDGHTHIARGSVRLHEGYVVEVREGHSAGKADTFILDAAGCTTLPGIINAHAHGCLWGPTMPSGSLPFSHSDVIYHRNRHLLDGTTTLLNVCGLALAPEIGAAGGHTLDIHVSTAHTPSNVAAAMAIDGAGLSDRHKAMTVDAMIAGGAKALGEAGGGQTLGGGAQDYRFIPSAILAEAGISVHPRHARRLKEAIVGRALDGVGVVGKAELQQLMEECGLSEYFAEARLRRLIEETVMPPVALALKGLWEIAEVAARTGLPAIFHTALPTINTLLQIAATYPTANLVAGHANHPSFTVQETLDYASQLRALGVTIDVSTLDCVHTRFRNDPANLDALVLVGLVDTISTDFAGGDWDSILSALQRMINRHQVSPAIAVAFATGNVAAAFPQLAGDRGMIEPGRRADLVVCESHNLSRVRHVLVNGAIAVWNGAIVQTSPSLANA